MPTKENLETFIETLRIMHVSDSKEFGSSFVRIVADSRETVRNLGLLVGALAAGALILLSSEVKTDHTVVLIGIIALIVEEVIIFGWLLHAQNIDAKKVLKQKQDTLGPISKILNAYQDVQEGKLTPQQFQKDISAWRKEHNEKTRLFHKSVQENPPNPSHWDVVFIGVFGFGAFFIVLGLLSPYL